MPDSSTQQPYKGKHHEWPDIGWLYYDNYNYATGKPREQSRIVEVVDTDTMTERVQVRVVGGHITNGRSRGKERWIMFRSLLTGYRPLPEDTEIPRGHE